MHIAPSLTGQALGVASSQALTSTPLSVEQATESEREELLQFLSERPLHNVAMAGWMTGNGVVSPLHRGAFYTCRDFVGRLEGVALIGHNTTFDARTDRAVEAFAHVAGDATNLRMVYCEEEKMPIFREHFARHGRRLRQVCSEILYECLHPANCSDPVRVLRRATLEDLPLVVLAHAGMVREEAGVNPLDFDPAGFQERCARRILDRKVWVLVEGGELVFKADVVAETSYAVYIEGLYVSPEHRGKGVGLRCLTQLTYEFMKEGRFVCEFVNTKNLAAQCLYEKAGYEPRGTYTKVYL